MPKTHPKRTKDAIEQRQTQDFCNDCDRYHAFCSGQRVWFDDEYWVCEKCIKNDRPETILSYIGTGDSR